MNVQDQHALLSVLRSEDRPFRLLELADRLYLTPEQTKTICNELLSMDLIDVEPLPRMIRQREVEFGFVLADKGRSVFGQTAAADPRPMMEKANTPG
jgi:hypothetical protein